jgi:hypothetical protein
MSQQSIDDQFDDPPEEEAYFDLTEEQDQPLRGTAPPPLTLAVTAPRTTRPNMSDVLPLASSLVPHRSKINRPMYTTKVRHVQESHVNCNSTFQVHKAARLVSQNLRLFPEASPGVHLQAAVAVENFGRKVFLPYILAQAHDESIEDQDRVFYATLLALREVLAQNADTFFQLPSTQRDDADQSEEDLEEENAHAKLLMSTTICMAACQAAGKDDELLLEFIQEDFKADRVGPDVNLRTPHGKSIPPEESLAYKVGYNMALEKRAKGSERVSLPEPTACWMSVVEQIPAALKKGTSYDM